jgi:ATP-binding cassette, subfamily B, multidrug efflux pump
MKSLRHLIPYLRPYRWQIAIGLALVVVASAAQAVVLKFLQHGIDAAVSHAPLAVIWRTAAIMLGLALVGGAARYGMREVLNGVSRYVEYDLRNALFAHLERLDAAYYARTRTGDIMARLTNDLSAVRMAAGPAIMYLIATVSSGLFSLGFMLHISPRLTVLALLPMLVLPIVMVRLGRIVHDRFEAVQQHFSTMTTHAQENLSGTRIIRAYRQEGAEVKRWGVLNEEYLARNMHLVRLYGIMQPAFGLMAGLAAVVVLGVGGSLALHGTISIGEFVAFGFFLGALTWPLIALGWVINLFERGAASMTRLQEIFAVAPSIADPAPAAVRALPAAHGGRSIEFRHVSFHYPATGQAEPRWVLRDVNFVVPAGGTLGLVGATGSGKSALIDLIPRIFDPQQGDVLIDGVPVRDLPLATLRAQIGMVPQESLLFSDTIASNLSYGTDEVIDVATTDDAISAAVDAGLDGALGDDSGRWAAGIAQLSETIGEFPGGYETMLGERGINLSGGQKQRAALARALARRPAIVLLDDALSAVDTHTEAAILRALREALSGRTAIIASHRISAIRDAGWIIVLDDGRVVEQGRHDDLIALGGRYWSLLRRQQLVEAIEDEAESATSAAAT